MGFFSALLGAGEGEAPKSAEVFNVLEVINAHVQWKVSLENYLNGTSEETLDPQLICRDDQCKLGKWIHGPALQRFHADDAGFKALRDDHAHFHVVASRVVDNIQKQNKEAAQALLHGEYSYASHRVVHAITELQKILSV